MNTKIRELLQREVGLVCAKAVEETNNPQALAELRKLLHERALAAAETSRLLSDKAELYWQRYCELSDAESELWPQEGVR